MDNNGIKDGNGSVNGQSTRLPELVYQKRLIRRIILAFAPSTLFYTGLLYYQKSYVQALLIGLLFINEIVGMAIDPKIKTLGGMIKLRRYSTIAGYILFAACILYGMLFVDLPGNMAWCYFFPMGLVLFLGRRTGFYYATAFCITSALIIVFSEPARLFTGSALFVKLNSVIVLFSLVGMAYIAEKTRVRVQKDLFKARNNFQMAEERQRAINTELQHEIQLRTQSEKALSQSESRYRALFEESAVSLWEEDWSKVKSYLDELPQEAVDDLFAYLKQNPQALENCISLIQVTAVNRATLSLYGADSIKTLLKNLSTILPPQSASYMLERVVSLYLNRRYDAEHGSQTLDGRHLSLLISSTVPVGYEDTFERVFTSIYDITERVAMDQEKKRVEQQLQQARQMQAVATLAGGIAHQFNNALAVIFGGLDLIESGDVNDPKNKSFFDSLQSSATRMSRLTDQLLAYAHGGKYQPKNFSANDLINDILKSDRIKPGPSIHIHTELAADILPACGDVTQIKMVMEAVLANALESFSNGGEITISTYNRSIAEDGADEDSIDLSPGHYAVMSVKYTGVGMDQETCRRIFEPFFTTKFFGRGLGMAAAYGIVTNHDGMITVTSEPQKGTCVNIYLPAADSLQNQPRRRLPSHHKMAS